MTLLSIDPSVHNVGWALFNTKAKNQATAWQFGTWHPTGFNLEMKITDVIQTIDSQIGEFDFLCTERPAFFSSERGQIAAHMNYTIDLAYINGYLAGWFRKDHRRHFGITANQWKGTINKTITGRRFFRSFPHVKPSSLDEHAIDAIMLARFCVDQFLCTTPAVKLMDRSPTEMRKLLG